MEHIKTLKIVWKKVGIREYLEYPSAPPLGPGPPSTTPLPEVVCLRTLCLHLLDHVSPSILEFCLFHHIIDAQFKNFARSIPRAKYLIPQRENMEFTPLVLATDVSYPRSNVLKAELFLFVKYTFAILALIHIRMAYII